MAEIVVGGGNVSSHHDPTSGQGRRRTGSSQQNLLNEDHQPSRVSGGASSHPPRTSRSNHGPPIQEEIMEEEELDLKYGAAHVIKLFVPVTICVVLVVASITSIEYYTEKGDYLVYTPFHEDSDDAGTLAWMSVANALIMLAVIAVMTVLLVIAYKYECRKLIYGWLFVSSVMLLFLFSYLYLSQILKAVNLPMDYITLAIIIWNFGIMGMLSIYWKSPLILQQAYLIFVSALMALIFIKYLPNYTTWTVLGVISLWDLFAVLSPCGPLRILVETAQERNEQIFPSLIYTSGVVYSLINTATGGGDQQQGESPVRPTRSRPGDRDTGAGAAPSEMETRGGRTNSRQQEQGRDRSRGRGDGQQHTDDAVDGFNGNWRDEDRTRSRQARVRNYVEENPDLAHRTVVNPSTAQQRERHQQQMRQMEEEEEDNGVKLGLGDFIFYSILIGKASSAGDWNTTLACFMAILIGLCLTLVFLALFRRALPALPISIFFGLLFYFLTSEVISPFCNELSRRQIYI